jgi:hypothetical protein
MDRFTLALIIPGLVLVSHMALAQTNFDQGTSEQSNLEHMSPEQRNCRHTQGKLVEVYDPEKKTAFGKLRNSGWLDGTTLTVDDSVPFPTPDLNKVTFSTTITLTTDHGQLRGKRVTIFDVVTGFGTDMSDIDGSASTGIFAGATGVLYVNGFRADTLAQGPYHSVVYARVCFAEGAGRPDK